MKGKIYKYWEQKEEGCENYMKKKKKKKRWNIYTQKLQNKW